MQQWLKVHPHATMVSLVYIQQLLTGSGIKTSGSESRPRKVELTRAFKKRDDYREYFKHNNENCTCCYYNQPYDSDIH